MCPKNRSLAFSLAVIALTLAACGVEQGAPPEDAVAAAEGPGCSLESLRELPDVRITAVTEEAAPVPHCKMAAIIGTETNFELLLPENQVHDRQRRNREGGFGAGVDVCRRGFPVSADSWGGSKQHVGLTRMRFALIRRTPRGLVWFIVPLVLVGLVAFAYRDAPKNVFHFDDGLNISRHPPIMIERLTAESVLNAGRESFLPSRPLPSMTFAIDWWRGNGSPKAFQQTNVAIHAASSLVIFALLFTVLLRTGHSESIAGLAAFIAAALWACHPIHVQAVTYIVQRMASMAAFFTVLTVLLFRPGIEGNRGDCSVPCFARRIRCRSPWPESHTNRIRSRPACIAGNYRNIGRSRYLERSGTIIGRILARL
jgi:hypothetical protein